MDNEQEFQAWRLHGESSDVEIDDTDDDERTPYDNLRSFLIPKLQSRKVVSKAHWNEDIGVAQVIKIRGGMWGTTGIVRNGKLYCSIEETLFLAERGALIVTNYHEKKVSLEDLYEKLNQRKCGCTWEAFEAYKHLKSLGYIVKRHGISWSMKSDKRSVPVCKTTIEADDVSSPVVEAETLALRMGECIQMNDLEPEFDVYMPNSRFRKSSPGDPSFMLYVSRGFPFTRSNFEAMEKKCYGTPLKICLIDHGWVSIFSYNSTELPALI